MSTLRPTEILLGCGRRLFSTPGGNWYCFNSTVGVADLRDVIGSLSGDEDIAAFYDSPNTLENTYNMIADVRRQYGYDFKWSAHAPDSSAIVLMDELDDICCESRVWISGGAPRSKTYVAQSSAWLRPPPTGTQHAYALSAVDRLTHAHNQRIGLDITPRNTTFLPPAPYSVRMIHDSEESFWLFSDREGRSFMHCSSRRPHATECEETRLLVEYLCELSHTLVEKGPPSATLD